MNATAVDPTTASGSAIAGQEQIPPVPETLEASGLSPDAVISLLAKTLYVRGVRTGEQLAEDLCLPFPLVDDLLLDLQGRRMIEVRSSEGAGRGGYRFDLAGAGRERAREALAASKYVGPAPVPLELYREWVGRQSIGRVRLSRETILHGFPDLVLDPESLELIGPAVSSARSLFLHGAPGDGKTVLAEGIARLFGGAMYVPHAVDLQGEIMVVYDPIYHRPARQAPTPPAEQPWLHRENGHDRRFVRVARPVVLTGGDLTMEQLDLQYDDFAKLYQAPFQVKSNGGVLIVDDFGRQRMQARELLNRWIIPLEKQLDFLTMHTGSKFPVPFDCMLIFATNLEPKHLIEEAFLRRIHYKVRIPSPTQPRYLEIFRRAAQLRGVEGAVEPAVEHLFREYYDRLDIAPRACHPRDVLEHLCDAARFQGIAPRLSPSLLDQGCRSYFIEASLAGGESKATGDGPNKEGP